MVYVSLFTTMQEDPVSRIRRFSVAAMLTSLLIALGAPAFATSPVTTTGIVTDPTGWLTDSDRTTIETAARTARSKGVSIDVVIVDNFSNMDAAQWCEQTLKNSVASNGTIIYYIGYETRKDGSCVKGGSISSSVRAEARAVAEAKLSSNPLTPSDAAAGAVAFIDHVASNKNSTTSSTGSHSSSSSSSFSLFGTGRSLLPSILVGFLLISYFVRRNSRRSVPTAAQTPTQPSKAPVANAAEMATLANRQLLAADEQVRSASDELDFARLQFGIAATDEFSRTLEAAKAAVSRGFAAQQRMEDAHSDAEKASLASAIMRDLGTYMNPLSAMQDSFEHKRSEQASLPRRISEASERLAEQRGDLERASTELVSISGIYPAQMLASLQDNPEQALALLATAETAIATAKREVDSDRTLAESSLDTAHRALMMAKHQTDAIFSAKSDLDAIRERLSTAIGSISADITDVTSLGAEPAVFDPLVADARTAIAEAQAALMNTGDPLAALEHLRASEAMLDSALAPLRTQRENNQKARASAQSQISLAETAIERAQRYVQGRRGAMDLSVRSTLHSAEQSLKAARASLDADPAKASTLASDARASADRVLATPLSEAGAPWDSGQSSRSTSTMSSVGSSLGEALLWSILMSNSGSSSHHRNRWDNDHDSWSSGSSWGGSSGGGGGISSDQGNF